MISRRKALRSSDPVEFARYFLGVNLWSKQVEVLQALQSHRRICVKSGHGVGKSYVTAIAAIWWLLQHDDAIVIITAPITRQAIKICFGEVKRFWNQHPELLKLADPLEKDIKIDDLHYLSAFSTDDQTKFQGLHGSVLIICDEANGIPDDIFVGINSCLTSANNSLLMIGNPLVPSGYFYRSFDDPAYKKISISCREHPNIVGGEPLIPGAVEQTWIDETEAEYKDLPQIVAAKIDAEFPSGAVNTLIPYSLFDSANSKSTRNVPIVVSCDPARFGDNLTAVAILHGLELKEIRTWSQASTTDTALRLLDIAKEVKADILVVDDTGVGGGVTDYIRSQRVLYKVVGFSSGSKAADPRFFNRIAEAWFTLKKLLHSNVVSFSKLNTPTLRILREQLCTRNYNLCAGSTGEKLQLEKKADYCKRGYKSPDLADAYVMGIYSIVFYG